MVLLYYYVMRMHHCGIIVISNMYLAGREFCGTHVQVYKGYKSKLKIKERLNCVCLSVSLSFMQTLAN